MKLTLKEKSIVENAVLETDEDLVMEYLGDNCCVKNCSIICNSFTIIGNNNTQSFEDNYIKVNGMTGRITEPSMTTPAK